MPDSATNFHVIRIMVPGEDRFYRECACTYRRARSGARAQPVGSLAIGSHMPRRTENYQAKVSFFAAEAMAGRPLLTSPIRLHARAYVAIPSSLPKCRREEIRRGAFHPRRIPDLTDIIKMAEDALQGVVFEDDKEAVPGADDTGRYLSRRPRLETDVDLLTSCRLQAQELSGDADLPDAQDELMVAG